MQEDGMKGVRECPHPLTLRLLDHPVQQTIQ